MLNGLFELIANTLNFFYTLVPNYAIAIALLTIVVMLITTPLTLKGTRSMIEMQRLQPQIRKLQLQYKDDRQKLNEELMAFYKEHEINPVGGCLPLLIQAPVFSILFYVVQGLTREAKFVGVQQLVHDNFDASVVPTEGFRPKYLANDTELYQSLVGTDHMNAFGVDLSQSTSTALSDGFVHALPYIGLVAVIAFLSWYQQKQIMGRNANAEVGQQHYITRSLYRGEDSVGVQAQKAMAELREAKKKEDGAAPGKAGANKAAATKKAAPARKGAGTTTSKSSGNGSSARSKGGSPVDKAPAGATASGTKPHPRSRKKKKRR